MASNLTFGQFVKAIASFLAPIIMAWGLGLSASFGLSWRILFPIYGIIGVAATLFPIAMGAASDAMGSQLGAVLVMTVGVIYLACFMLKIKK